MIDSLKKCPEKSFDDMNNTHMWIYDSLIYQDDLEDEYSIGEKNIFHSSVRLILLHSRHFFPFGALDIKLLKFLLLKNKNEMKLLRTFPIFSLSIKDKDDSWW